MAFLPRPRARILGRMATSPVTKRPATKQSRAPAPFLLLAVGPARAGAREQLQLDPATFTAAPTLSTRRRGLASSLWHRAPEVQGLSSL